MNRFFEQFDEGVDREGTGCHKWDGRLDVFGRADVIPMWVADMDFAAPDAVIEAMVVRAKHGAFGYEADDPENVSAVLDWLNARHGLQAERDWVSFSAGVVDSLYSAVSALAQPGDLVAVQPPVYGPFYSAVKQAGCRVYRNRLVQTEAGWRMDIEDLERGLREGVKLLLLCSPHNPVGRVWTRDELSELAALCARYGARIVSDEIHSDLILPGYRHTPILSVDRGALQFISATKTFNLAALRHSSAVIADPEARAAFHAEVDRRGVGSTNLFGALAQRVAYRHGGEWVDALCQYIDGNRRFVEEFLRDRVPAIHPARLEGSYLLWLDFRALGLSQDELYRAMIDKAGVGLLNGVFFGEEGAGFLRMNLGTPRRFVEGAMERIERAFRRV